jgi:hypothetical protein
MVNNILLHGPAAVTQHVHGSAELFCCTVACRVGVSAQQLLQGVHGPAWLSCNGTV